MTSHDVVEVVRRMTDMRAVGHTGTLDPEARGLLLLCLGRATKFARFFEGLSKTYWTVMRLGICTDTQDATGKVLRRQPVLSLSTEQLQRVLHQFTGQVQQLPPMYSAVKYQGKRLYRLARQGRTVTRQVRDVFIQRLALLDVRGEWITLGVTCSKGTYIRTLCEDIGLALGCGAHMVHLQRCQVGPFRLTQAYTLDYLQQLARQGDLPEALIPLPQALDFLPVLSLTSQQYEALQRGQGMALPTVLEAMPRLVQHVSCYRLRAPSSGTFAVIYRRASAPDRWKFSYLETPSDRFTNEVNTASLLAHRM
jgi:tRNA pseudouridine55 synthase